MFRSISGSIIHSNDFDFIEFRFPNHRPNAFDCLANGILFVVTRNDYRCLHSLHFHVISLIHGPAIIGWIACLGFVLRHCWAVDHLHDRSFCVFLGPEMLSGVVLLRDHPSVHAGVLVRLLFLPLIGAPDLWIGAV